jgi:threonine dehydrogenase-like Zn-dependent dehydrogenase
MRALTVIPGQPHSGSLSDVAEPSPAEGSLLVQTIAIGICGTDAEILEGRYGTAPPDRQQLILGHESIGRVVEAPETGGFTAGDLVVGVVRRPDPVPCSYCAAGEWDMCRNGLYTERGIKGLDGYGSERFRIEPEFAVKVGSELGDLGVLIEPSSVVAKAWAHVDWIGARSSAWRPGSVLVTGAGPIGLLAALMGRQRGLDVHIFDRAVNGPKPLLAKDLGATYHCDGLSALADLTPDIIVECTGATTVIADVMTRTAASGILCLAGVSSGGQPISVDLGDVNRRMVLENDVVFGSVNANRTHYEAGAEALARADRQWLSRLITRRVPLDQWQEALRHEEDDVKVIIEF